ncbi:MAG: ACT domain-containing protein [Xylanivirga thermophila]|jgi:ACT domain-containing protein|uniref:ACT domain-containing protein n=1 Tax=Xylanivirga thermophila TaxID=2496273 RepID=UPI00101D3EE4|nr:ACT domain-containing protein [Xylanivirga thermophila]
MKAIVTVIGKDKVGIISNVSTALAECDVNILDITQTIMQEYFTMMMLIDLSNMNLSFDELKEKLDVIGQQMGVSIKTQHEDVFKSMHRI